MLCHAIWRVWEHQPVSCGLKWLVLCFVGWGFLVNQWCFSKLFIFLAAICPTLRQLIPCAMLLVFLTIPSPYIASAHAWLRLGYLNCSNLLWFSFLFTNIFLTATESGQRYAHVKCVFPHFSSALAWSPFSTEFSKRVISHTAPKGQTMVHGPSYVQRLLHVLKTRPVLQHIQETQHIHMVLSITRIYRTVKGA